MHLDVWLADTSHYLEVQKVNNFKPTCLNYRNILYYTIDLFLFTNSSRLFNAESANLKFRVLSELLDANTFR